MPRLQTQGIPLSGDHVACMCVCLSDPDQLDPQAFEVGKPDLDMRRMRVLMQKGM